MHGLREWLYIDDTFDRSSSMSSYGDANWDQYRDSKEFRDHKGETVWYRTTGQYTVWRPPTSLKASVDQIYVHYDERTSQSRYWVVNNAGCWVSVRQGDRQPSNAARRLNIRHNGDPSWITIASYAVHRSRSRRKKGPQVRRSATVHDRVHVLTTYSDSDWSMSSTGLKA